jgi:hypothetical protein
MKNQLLLVVFTLALLGGSPAPAQAPASTRYLLSPDFPKYATAHVEVRDPAGVRWPSFFYGKPATNGTINLDQASPTASFVLNCDQRPQKQGDQSRRVFGELFGAQTKGGAVVIVTAISDLAAAKEKAGTWSGAFSGSVEVDGHKVPFNQAPGTLRTNPAGRGQEKNEAVLFDFSFESKAAAFGLKSVNGDAPLQVRVAASGYAPGAGERDKSKK